MDKTVIYHFHYSKHFLNYEFDPLSFTKMGIKCKFERTYLLGAPPTAPSPPLHSPLHLAVVGMVVACFLEVVEWWLGVRLGLGRFEDEDNLRTHLT